VLSYRHAFHAGNSADVLKHGVLIFCLDYLGQKETPFLCVDTHAGPGHYTLTQGYAAKNREWEGGIGRLDGPQGEAAPGLVRRYLSLVREVRQGDAGYPGSPALIRALLRPQDRGAYFELHPQDYALLKENFQADPRLILRRENGFSALKSLLPPRSRRACVFIDPPYELAEDHAALGRALEDGLRRFSPGLYIIWYPLLGGTGEKARNSGTGLMERWQGNRCRLELRTGLPQDRGMYGSGLAIYNPPWTLKAALEEALPCLARSLGGTEASWLLDWRA
jgi:23S rRNA (adenine2030-N6)-methyltransferase